MTEENNGNIPTVPASNGPAVDNLEPIKENTDVGDTCATPSTDGNSSVDPDELPSGCNPIPDAITSAHEPTESEVRAWRARNWTVQQPTVVKCGHKLNLRQFPNQSNCWPCWEAWFSAEENQQGLAAVHDTLLKEGNKAVIAMHGKKFTRMFAAFLRNKLLSLASPETQALSGLEVTNGIC